MANDIVVYTAVFNNYDELFQPEIVPDGVDFVCFTDDPDIACGVWEAEVIDDEDLSAKLMSGKRKVLPHRFFPEYKYSIWVDGNLHLHGPIQELLDYYLDGHDLAVPAHSRRDCIYEEGEICVELGKADPEAVHAQLARYRDVGFPESFGLSATRIMLRRHNADNVVEAMEAWWDEYQRGAERDQLSFEYAAWESDLNYNQFDLDFHDSEYVVLHPHRPSDGVGGDVWALVLSAQLKGPERTTRVFELLSRTLDIYLREDGQALLRKAGGYVTGRDR